MTELTLILLSIFCKVFWHGCTEFNQSWKDLRKTLWSHENIQWLTDLSVANIIFVQIHETWYFESLMSKKQSIINKRKRAISAASTLMDRMLIKLYLQNWVPWLQVLHSFLSNGSTWYVHLKVLVRYVNSILYLHREYQKRDAKVWTYHCFICIEYIYLNQRCIDSFVLISSNLM